MMPVTNLDVIMTVVLLGTWFLFPVGIFISMARLDHDMVKVKKNAIPEKIEKDRAA